MRPQLVQRGIGINNSKSKIVQVLGRDAIVTQVDHRRPI
jgi:hypothetical protein